MMKFYKYIVCFSLMFFSNCKAMIELPLGLKAHEHTAFTGLAAVNGDPLVAQFKLGCKTTPLDPVIEQQLGIIAADPYGAGMLRIMTSMIAPYAECARTLELFINSIPTGVLAVTAEKIAKAKKVVFLYSLLGVNGAEFLTTAVPASTKALFQALHANPHVFPDATAAPVTVLTGGTFVDDPASLVVLANMFWNVAVSDAVKSIFPLLREKMFAMEIGARSEYSYNPITLSCIIRLNSAPISAYCLVNTPLCSFVGSKASKKFVHSYAAEKKDFEPDFWLLHEMNHHFVISLISDVRDSFDEVIPFLMEKGIDATYILKLPEIFTDFSEFQNITGITVKDRRLCYNRYSEGAYVLSKKGWSLRCAHVGKMFFNVPVGIMKLVREGSALVGIALAADSAPKLEGFIEWKGF